MENPAIPGCFAASSAARVPRSHCRTILFCCACFTNDSNALARLAVRPSVGAHINNQYHSTRPMEGDRFPRLGNGCIRLVGQHLASQAYVFQPPRGTDDFIRVAWRTQYTVDLNARLAVSILLDCPCDVLEYPVYRT